MHSSHYLNASGFKLGCNTYNVKITLELIPDPDMSIFFEKSRATGVSYISNRYSKVNIL